MAGQDCRACDPGVQASWLDTGDAALALLAVDTGPLKARFLPSAGARLLSLELDQREFLWRNPEIFADDFKAIKRRDQWPISDGTQASWANPGGSKTWPAPQGWGTPDVWEGPPDPILDSGEWSVRLSQEGPGDLEVAFVSPKDSRTGLEVTRRFCFERGAKCFDELVTFRNWTERPIRWSIWEVAQVDAANGGRVSVLNAPAVAAKLALNLRGGMCPGSQVSEEWIIPVQDAVGKVLLPGGLGVIEYLGSDGARLTLRYEVSHDPSSDYPDGGARAEVWMQSPQAQSIKEAGGLHPRASLVELETLSPSVTLAADQSFTQLIEWSVAVP